MTKQETNEAKAVEAKAAEKLAVIHARKTERVFNSVRKSNTNLFMTIRESYEAMFNEEYAVSAKENAAFRHYRIRVESFCDKSSFNKIISICKNDLIMSNLDRLPVAWSTLTKLNCALSDKTAVARFRQCLVANTISVDLTAKQLLALLNVEVAKKKTPTELTICFYSDQLRLMTAEEREIFETSRKALESISFTFKDMNKKTVEVAVTEAANDASATDTNDSSSLKESA